MDHSQRVKTCYRYGGMVTMETVLKQHNQIQLPQEICRRLELVPGIRFEVEINRAGTIILVPITKEMIEAHGKGHKAHVPAHK